MLLLLLWVLEGFVGGRRFDALCLFSYFLGEAEST